MRRLAAALAVCAALGGCAWFGLEVTNSPRMPECPPGRANCR